MRGFKMNLRQVVRHGDDRQVVAEIVGDSRVVIDTVFIPEERRSLYADESKALKFASGRIVKDDCPYDKVGSETRTKLLADRNISSLEDAEALFNEELKKAKRAYYDEIHHDLKELKHLFNQELEGRIPPELSQQSIWRTFGQYPSIASSLPVEHLKDRLEMETLYVLSHLVLQNQDNDLIFSVSGKERLNACLAELKKMQESRHLQLFVWEADQKDKQWQSYF